MSTELRRKVYCVLSARSLGYSAACLAAPACAEAR